MPTFSNKCPRRWTMKMSTQGQCFIFRSCPMQYLRDHDSDYTQRCWVTPTNDPLVVGTRDEGMEMHRTSKHTWMVRFKELQLILTSVIGRSVSTKIVGAPVEKLPRLERRLLEETVNAEVTKRVEIQETLKAHGRFRPLTIWSCVEFLFLADTM